MAGLPDPEPQHGEPTVANKITPEDLHLDWAEPARQLARVVRLGRAWTTFRGTRLRVLDAVPAPAGPDHDSRSPGTLLGPAVCAADGVLVLRQVQPESRSPMSADDWLRGVPAADGERLGTD